MSEKLLFNLQKSTNYLINVIKKNVWTFYKLLRKLVDKYNIEANTIFNVDESGYSTVQKRMQIIAKKGKRQVGGITSGERGVNTTVVSCTNAAGLYVPP